MRPGLDHLKPTRSQRRRGLACRVAAVGLLTGGLLAGCGGSGPTTLNPARVEQSIAASILAQRGIHAQVACPSGVPVAARQTFRCVAEVGVRNTTFFVTESDSAGHVTYVGVGSAAPALDSRTIASAIAHSILTERGVHATVSCPAGIPMQQGLSFVCIAHRPGGATYFDVEQVNGRGGVTYRAR